MAEFAIKDELFRSKRTLKHFSVKAGTSTLPLKIGMHSPSGIASSMNTTKNLVSKVSLVGSAVDAIIGGWISVSCSYDQPCAYVEYYSSSYSFWIPILCQLSSDGNFQATMVIEPFKASVVSKGAEAWQYLHQVLTMAVIAATLYCPCIREELYRQDSRMQEVFEEADTYIDISANYLDLKMTFDNLFRLCDVLYYGWLKNGCMIRYDVTGQDRFSAEVSRLRQSGRMLHIHETVNPQLEVFTENADEKEENTPGNTLFTEPLADFFERCKKGEFLIKYPWPESRRGMIVPLSFLESFFPTESFRLMLLSVWYQIREVQRRMEEVAKKYPGKKLSELVQEGAYDEVMGKNPINIKVMGKPGTGKTTVIEAVLASLGYPKGLINCKERMEEDEIEGQNKFVNGTVLNIPTRAGQLHSDGGAILLEEFNLPDPGILQGALGQALAYPFILKEDGYKEKRRHPLTIYFATMNIGTAGTKPMNEALSSRFPEGYVIEDVPEDEFISILVSAGYEKVLCRKVFRVYTKILNYLREYHEELSLSITLRHCLNALDKLKIGFTEKQAYENTFLSQLYSSDPEVAGDVRETLKLLV